MKMLAFSFSSLRQQPLLLLKALAALLCFGIFPTLIINSGLERVVSIKNQRNAEQKKFFMRARLAQMEKFADSGYFAHFLLRRACDKAAQKKAGWQKELVTQIAGLKKKYPDSFSFVIADRNNDLLEKISDEKSFKYLFKKAFALIDDLGESVKKQLPGNPEEVNDIDSRMKSLRPLLGTIVNVEEMCLPLLDSVSGKSILASADERRSHLWYYNSDRFKVIAFIDYRFISKTFGLQSLVNYFNTRFKDFEFGFSRFPAAEEEIFPKKLRIGPEKVTLALSRFENIMPGELFFEKDRVFSHRFLQQSLRGFCHTSARVVHPWTKEMLLAWLFKVILLAGFLIWVARLRFGNFISVKTKMVALFAYSLWIPGLFICFGAWEHYQQTWMEKVRLEKERSFLVLQAADQGITQYLSELGVRVNRFIEDRIKSRQEKLVDPDEVEELVREMKSRFVVDGGIMLNREGKNLMNFNKNSVLRNFSLFRIVGKFTLLYLNSEIERPEDFNNQVSLGFAHEFIDRETKPHLLGLGTFYAYCFYKYLRLNSDVKKNHLIMLFWELRKMQTSYSKSFFSKSKELLSKGHKIFAYMLKEERFFIPEDYCEEIMPLVNDARQNQFSAQNLFRFKDKNYIATSFRGKNLNQIVLCHLSPIDKIEAEMLSLRNRYLAGLVLWLTLTLSVMFLSHYYFLRPLKELKTAVGSIAQREFRFRAKVFSENELGKLGEAFNRSLENLEDLNVAATVQKTLLPQTNYSQNRLQTLIFNRSMSKLGGDCFFVGEKSSDSSIVFIGDATGHGIPAALTVAMARSVLIYEEISGFPTTNLLDAVNAALFATRKKRAPELMTGLCFSINSLTGVYTCFNAGHVMPMIVSADGTAAGYIRLAGFPAGLVKEPGYKPVSGQIKPGETLLLFTDGIIEAADDNGTPMGFDNFEKLVLSAYDASLSRFKEKLVDEIEKKYRLNDDDITLLMARFADV